MNADSTFQQLLERIQAGDEDAPRTIYEEYVPYLRMVVRRHITSDLRARFDSLDVVQSVWADLIVGLRRGRWSFESPGHLRAFLVRATQNRMIDYTRRHGKSAERQTRIDDAAACVDGGPRPSAEAHAKETWEAILKRCTPEQRPIVDLKRQGYSLSEIAEETGYHPSSIRRILYSLAEESRS